MADDKKGDSWEPVLHRLADEIRLLAVMMQSYTASATASGRPRQTYQSDQDVLLPLVKEVWDTMMRVATICSGNKVRELTLQSHIGLDWLWGSNIHGNTLALVS